MQNSNIAWTDVTWNPTHGCSKVSAGCDNCYAERISRQYGHTEGVTVTPRQLIRSPVHTFLTLNMVAMAPVYENVRPMVLDGKVKEQSRFHRVVYRRVGGPSEGAALLTGLGWGLLALNYWQGWIVTTVYGLPWELTAGLVIFGLYSLHVVLAPEEDLVEEVETTALGAFRQAALGIDPSDREESA